MKRSLVIGASGQVGSHLVTCLQGQGHEVLATYHTHPISEAVPLDIRIAAHVEKLIQGFNPTIVYLPGSTTNVDYCETHPIETFETNVVGACNVVKAVNQVKGRLIYFSSDYIFDGRSGPYSETDPANPVSMYGRQKLAAEHHISLFAHDHLIIRTTIVYGWETQEKNFVIRLLRSISRGTDVRVPMDQVGSPTNASNLAQISTHLASTSINGVINVAGPDLVSRYEFALAAAKAFALNSKHVIPVTTDTLGQVAKRPLNAGLKIDKARNVSTLPLVGYIEGLKSLYDAASRIEFPPNRDADLTL